MAWFHLLEDLSENLGLVEQNPRIEFPLSTRGRDNQNVSVREPGIFSGWHFDDSDGSIVQFVLAVLNGLRRDWGEIGSVEIFRLWEGRRKFKYRKKTRVSLNNEKGKLFSSKQVVRDYLLLGSDGTRK
jgi:hypothetical protein